MSLKALGLAAAMTALSGCEKPTEPTESTYVPAQQEVMSACERFRSAVGMEILIEIGSDPENWKLFPTPLAKAAWEDAHAETMAAAAALTKEDQGACLREIEEGK